MKKQAYLYPLVLMFASLVGIMAFLPRPSAAEVPITSSNYEEDSTFIPTPQRSDNEAIWEFASHVSPTLYDNNHVFFNFKKEFEFKEEVFFKEHSLAFGLKNDDEMRLARQTERVLRYQQFYKGIRVQEGVYAISRNSSGKILRATGTIIENINIDIDKRVVGQIG
jgi:hypothetical protein